ncbi:MAG: hypothetical protein M3P24_00980 [Gemmatimonadota bacterium]|nr:hypothetical protein [Gemmatimonadota bacterium]
MADYERSTVLSLREIFQRADEIFSGRGELERVQESRHAVTYTGGEGTVTVEAHRHGPSTVVTAVTDRLRTSKVDGVVRYFMNQLPYQHGDPPRE